MPTYTDYTDQDVAFIKALKAKGVSKEASFRRLDAVKALPVSEPGLTGLKPASPPKEEPGTVDALAGKIKEGAAEEPSIIEEIVQGEAQGLTDIQRGVEGIKKTVSEGIAEDGLLGAIPEEVENKGLIKGTASGMKKNLTMALGEYVPALGADVIDVASGVFETLFTIPMTIAEEVPGVEPAFAFIGEKVGSMSGDITELVAPDATPEEKESMIKGLSNVIMIGALSLGGRAGGKVAEKVGGATKKAGEVAFESAVKPSTREAEFVQNYDSAVKLAKDDIKTAKSNKDPAAIEVATGKLEHLKESEPVTVAKTGAKFGVSGREKTVGVEARVEKTKLWRDKIEPALEQSTEVIQKADMFKKMEEYIESRKEPGRKADLQKAMDAIKKDYANYEEFPLIEAQNIKSGLDEFTPNKYWKGQDIASAYKQMKAEMAHQLRTGIHEKLAGVDIKTAYLDWANLKALEKVGIKGRTLGGLKGGTGTFVSTIWDLVTTPIKTTAGKYLYKAGDFMEFVSGKKDIKTVGEFLKSQGVTPEGLEKILVSTAVGENLKDQQTE